MYMLLFMYIKTFKLSGNSALDNILTNYSRLCFTKNGHKAFMLYLSDPLTMTNKVSLHALVSLAEVH